MQSQDVVRFSNQYPESITQLLISCLSWRHKHGPAAGGQRAAQSVHEGDPGHVTCTGDRGNDGCMHSSTLNSRHSQQDQPAASSTPSASGQPSAEPHRSNPARRSGERTGSKSASSGGGTEWDVHTHAHVHEAVLHYNVAGIKCEGCAARLKERVLAVPGVTRCTVAFSTGDVHVWALTQDGSSTAASTGPAARQHQHQATQPLSKGAEGSGNRHGLGTGGAKDGGSLAKSAGLIAGTSSMEGAMARGAVAKKGEDRSPLFPEQLQGSDSRTASTMRHMVGAVQSTIQLTDLAYRVTYLGNDD